MSDFITCWYTTTKEQQPMTKNQRIAALETRCDILFNRLTALESIALKSDTVRSMSERMDAQVKAESQPTTTLFSLKHEDYLTTYLDATEPCYSDQADPRHQDPNHSEDQQLARLRIR